MSYFGLGALMLLLTAALLAACLFAGARLTARWLGRGSFAELSERPLLSICACSAGGFAASYLATVALIFTGLIVTGEYQPSTAIELLPDGPAARAGLRPGDRIVRVGSTDIQDWNQVAPSIRAHGESEPVELTVERASSREVVRVTPEAGRIGILSRTVKRPIPILPALGRAAAMPARLFTSRFDAAPTELVGPVAIVKEVNSTSREASYLLLAGLLAVRMQPIFSVALTIVLAYMVVGERRRRRPQAPSG